MDIVLALHQFPPFGGGGTEVLAQWTAAALRERGHAVRLISAIPRRAATDAVVLPPGDVVRFLPAPTWPDDNAVRIRREYDDPAAGEGFGALLDERRPHIVHFLHLAGLTANALHATVARRIPAVFTATDFWFECPTIQLLLCDHSRCEGPRPDRLNCVRHLMEIRHPELSILSRLSTLDGPAAAGLKLASRVPGLRRMTASFEALRARSPTLLQAFGSLSAIIAPTARMRVRLARFGVAEERVHLIRYGVPRAETESAPVGRPTSCVLRIAYIGTLAAHKGPHLLVDALALLGDVALRVDLHGDLADTEYCRRLRQAAQSDARIRLCGRFPSATIGTLLDDTDVLVIPSLWDENDPLVLLQAIAHRCPVIVSNVPGLLESLRPEQDGWAFERNNARDLAGSLRRLVANPELLARVRRASTMVRSVDDHVGDLVSLYETCAAASATARS